MTLEYLSNSMILCAILPVWIRPVCVWELSLKHKTPGSHLTESLSDGHNMKWPWITCPMLSEKLAQFTPDKFSVQCNLAKHLGDNILAWVEFQSDNMDILLNISISLKPALISLWLNMESFSLFFNLMPDSNEFCKVDENGIYCMGECFYPVRAGNIWLHSKVNSIIYY